MQYALVDSTNTVVNVIVWDGVAPYSPGGEYTIVKCDQGEIGWTCVDGAFAPPQQITE